MPVAFDPEEPERFAPIEAALIAVPAVPVDGPVDGQGRVRLGDGLGLSRRRQRSRRRSDLRAACVRIAVVEVR